MDNSRSQIHFSWKATALLIISTIWSLLCICLCFVLKKDDGFADGRVMLATSAIYFTFFAAWKLGKIILLIARLTHIEEAKEDAKYIRYEIGYHAVTAVTSFIGIFACYIIFVGTVVLPTIRRGLYQIKLLLYQ